MLTATSVAPQLSEAGQVSILQTASVTPSTSSTEQFQSLAAKYTRLVQQPPSAAVIRRIEVGLAHGQSEPQILVALIGSRHAVQARTSSIYSRFLHRAPSRKEYARAMLTSSGNGDPRKIMLQVVSSPEYYRTQGGGTNAGYVQALYRDLFRRDASPDMVASNASELSHGLSRRKLAARMIHSPAFTSQFTRNFYTTILGKEPISTQLDEAATMLQRPNGFRGLVANIASQPVAELPGGPGEPPPPTETGPPFIVGPEIPSYDDNQGLSIKRVAGSLEGWTQNHLAAPFVVANAPNRTIGSDSVDWWGITLNSGDTVTLTIDPTGATTAADFAVRIWDPENSLVATLVGSELVTTSGATQVSYRAQLGGTYSIGISVVGNTQYVFNPSAAQPAPSGGSVETYTAEFYSTPGPNTDLIQILQKYENPSAAQNGWPTWSAGMNGAYHTLSQIAGWLKQTGDPNLLNYTDFKNVGDIITPNDYQNWLKDTWAPFAYLQNNSTASDVILNSYLSWNSNQSPYAPITLQEWTTIANSLLHPATSGDNLFNNEFTRVYDQLELANDARTNIQTFLNRFSAWSSVNESVLIGQASNVASLLQAGVPVPQPPPVPKPVGMSDFWGGLLDVFENVAITAFGIVTDGVGSVVASGVVTAATDVIKNSASGSGGSGNSNLTSTTKVDNNLLSTAQEIDANMEQAYVLAFSLLNSQDFLSNVYSNFGVLEAFQGIQFQLETKATVSSTNALAKAYETSAWQQLLPRAFMWQEVGFQSSSTMPYYANFVPAHVYYSYISPRETNFAWDRDYAEFDNNAQVFQSMQSAISTASQQAVAMQNGQNYSFPGYKPSPSADDWGGAGVPNYPGPISNAANLTGKSKRFYTVSFGILSQNIHTDENYVGNYWSSYDIFGAYVQEWALLSLDGHYEMSDDAAKVLFGTGTSSSDLPLKEGPGLSTVNQVVISGAISPPAGSPNSIVVWDNFASSNDPANPANGTKIYVYDGSGNQILNTEMIFLDGPEFLVS